MNTDMVFWGSIVCILGAVVVLGFLAVKVGNLIRSDAERHSK